MTLIDEIDEYFGARSLYEVIGTDKNASEQDIKKAYRKASLKTHPDRVAESEKERATKRFQVLAQVHFILSDPERRKLYDDHGIIANEESLESEADWANYWRLLFPKITQKDIQNFLKSYEGSEEEEKDLIGYYNRFEGDLDKISESFISYDETKTTAQLVKLIEEGKIQEYRNFMNESEKKKNRRKMRAKREAEKAEKLKDKNEDNLEDLTALIQRRSQGSFNSMIASLEAKYGAGSRGTKRKRSNLSK